jgi:hypothetical protein
MRVATLVAVPTPSFLSVVVLNTASTQALLAVAALAAVVTWALVAGTALVAGAPRVLLTVATHVAVVGACPVRVLLPDATHCVFTCGTVLSRCAFTVVLCGGHIRARRRGWLPSKRGASAAW